MDFKIHRFWYLLVGLEPIPYRYYDDCSLGSEYRHLPSIPPALQGVKGLAQVPNKDVATLPSMGFKPATFRTQQQRHLETVEDVFLKRAWDHVSKSCLFILECSKMCHIHKEAGNTPEKVPRFTFGLSLAARTRKPSLNSTDRIYSICKPEKTYPVATSKSCIPEIW